MTYIKPREKMEFEKVILDEWVEGTISDIQEFKDVEKIYKNKETGEMEPRKIDQVRFKLTLDGYSFPHYTRKMTQSMNERSNLFIFLQQIYGQNIVPDVGVELDVLKGLRVKTMWNEVPMKEGGVFQYPDKIRPLSPPPAIWVPHDEPEIIEPEHEVTEETPF